MAKDRASLRLLASELEMLDLLWKRKGATLAEAHQDLKEHYGYTTVQTRLNRMVKKGLVKRSRATPAKYHAAVTAEEVATHDLNLLMHKVSRGGAVPLIASLVNNHFLTHEEIRELKKLIQSAERRSQSQSSQER